MSISPAIAALIERMDEHPDEFVNGGWAPVSGAGGYFTRTRWEAISVLFYHDESPLFNTEEVKEYRDKIGKLLRTRIDESIIAEIVGNAFENELEFRNKQLSLPLGTSMINATQPRSVIAQKDALQDALRIIRGQTP